MTLQNFTLIGCSILHIQLCHHNEGTYDIIKKKIRLIAHAEYLPCAKFQFFPWYSFGDAEVQSVSFFPIWLPHHMIYDIIIIITTFYKSCRTYGETFVSICQVVPEKREQQNADTHVRTYGTDRLTLLFASQVQANNSQSMQMH